MKVVTVVRRGKSLGFVLPKEIVERQNIKPGDVLSFPIIIKKANKR